MSVYKYRCRDTRCKYQFQTYFARSNPTGELNTVACPKCRRDLADKLQPEEDKDVPNIRLYMPES